MKKNSKPYEGLDSILDGYTTIPMTIEEIVEHMRYVIDHLKSQTTTPYPSGSIFENNPIPRDYYLALIDYAETHDDEVARYIKLFLG